MIRALALCVLAATMVLAQHAETYQVRLTPVSMDAAMKVNIAGSGIARATLTGNTLQIDGSFDGLLSPATTAQVRTGSLTGVRGPVIFDLKVAAGSVTGTFTLTPDQIDRLRHGRLYIQLASEKAPDGNLWGWLLP